MSYLTNTYFGITTFYSQYVKELYQLQIADWEADGMVANQTDLNVTSKN